MGAKSIYVDLFDAYNKETYFSDLKFIFPNNNVLYAHKIIFSCRCPTLLEDLFLEANVPFERMAEVGSFEEMSIIN